jgi:hypothetical protein
MRNIFFAILTSFYPLEKLVLTYSQLNQLTLLKGRGEISKWTNLSPITSFGVRRGNV